MKTAVILHGVCDADEYFNMDFPSPSNAHWIPWLQQKFLRSGVLCQALEMPAPYDPHYDAWAATFEQLCLKDDTIIVGHSAGCGFILKWLSSHPDCKLAALILVAPWLDPSRRCGNFLQCDVSLAISRQVKNIHILYSLNEDTEGVEETKNIILATFPTTNLHTFPDKGHFCYGDLGAVDFPPLWDICCRTIEGK